MAALLLGGYGLFLRDWWIPVVPPLLAGVGSSGLVTAYVAANERMERRQVTRLFSRFLTPKVTEEIWEQRDEFMRSDEKGRPESRWGVLTVLMLDLENYTGISEKRDPRVLMDWVNEFTGAMANIVEHHGGVVDDYAGDGIKANFGFPVPTSDENQIAADAADAVRCALAMGEEMDRLNEAWRKQRLPAGRLRIGIVTGPAVVGVIGSGQSLKYTSVGETVNIAARLESFDKDSFSSHPDEGSWRVLVGAETMHRLDEDFHTLDLGVHALKGKTDKIQIYRVLEIAGRQEDKSDGGGEP
jgi:adenylate cyclase